MTVTLTRDTEGRATVGDHPVAADVSCDHCGEPLHPARGGVAAWEPEEQERYLEVVFLHVGCVEGYRGVGSDDRHRPVREIETVELAPFLAALVHNVEVAG